MPSSRFSCASCWRKPSPVWFILLTAHGRPLAPSRPPGGPVRTQTHPRKNRAVEGWLPALLATILRFSSPQQKDVSRSSKKFTRCFFFYFLTITKEKKNKSTWVKAEIPTLWHTRKPDSEMKWTFSHERDVPTTATGVPRGPEWVWLAWWTFPLALCNSRCLFFIE